jgi:hypothetical protein
LAFQADFSRCLVLVVGDFRGGSAEALALRELGVRVFAAGLAHARDRRLLEQAGVAVSGLVRARQHVIPEAVDCMGGCDVTLVVEPAWDAEYSAIVEVETERAAMDGRARSPVLRVGDPRYDFLKTPAAWAAYAAALAAGAGNPAAKEFAAGQTIGHTNKNSAGRRSGRAAPSGSRTKKSSARRDRTLRSAAG